MSTYPVIQKAEQLFSAIEEEFNSKVNVGMSESEIFEAVESIDNFPVDELRHVIENSFNWNKRYSEFQIIRSYGGVFHKYNTKCSIRNLFSGWCYRRSLLFMYI